MKSFFLPYVIFTQQAIQASLRISVVLWQKSFCCSGIKMTRLLHTFFIRRIRFLFRYLTWREIELRESILNPTFLHMSSLRQAIRLGYESQSSLVVEIYLLFGNKTTRLLRTRTVDCWEAWQLFSSIHYVQSRSIFFQKSGVDFTDFARLNVRFVRTNSFSLVSAFAIACMFFQ